MQELQTILPNGTILRDRYIVEGMLGKGGFGAVYLVRDQRVKGNLFALKEIVDSDKKERARFAFECEVLKRLDHPALPRVYRVFEDDKNMRAYMLMDYIEGPNLETLRQKQPEKRFPLPKVMSMMTPIIAAVTYLHHQQPPIIHRDIKPSNIIVSTSNDADAVLVDFGIAKEYEPDSTTTAVRRCSPGYGAPEQYSRGTNIGTDIYGLGATFYASLTGIVPDDAFYRMTQLGSSGLDPLEPVDSIVPSIPPHISQAIMKAMAISSKDRFPSVQAFWQAMKSAPIVSVTPIPPVPNASHEETTAGANSHLQTAVKGTPYPPPVSNGNPDTPPVVGPAYLPPAAAQRRKKRRLWPLLLLLLVLLAGIVSTAGFIFAHNGTTTPKVGGASTPASNTSHGVTPVPTTASSPTGRTTPTGPSSKASPVATNPPPPPVNGIPYVAGTHNGRVNSGVYNQSANLTAQFTQKQGQNVLGGYVTISGGLSGTGPISSGSVSNGGAIQFLVASNQVNPNLNPIYFTGSVASNGSMSGNYCSVLASAPTTCNAGAGGSGSWTLGSAPNPGGGS